MYNKVVVKKEKLITLTGGVTMSDNTTSSLNQLEALKELRTHDDREELDQYCAEKELSWLSESLDQ